MGILNFITQACDTLTATTAPTVDALGVHMVIALATIMLVWFGAQEALASASGGPGFSMGDFLNYFMLASFAYAFVAFYDSAIPGLGYSLTGFINGGAQYLVGIIGTDSVTQIQTTLANAAKGGQPGLITAIENPYLTGVHLIITVTIALLSATVTAIIAYGAIALTVVKMVGPILIPFMVFEKTDFLFWGWLRAFIGFAFYKVIAAGILSIIANLLAQYYSVLPSFLDPGLMVQQLPLLIILTVVAMFLVLRVPSLTLAIFSGSTGGYGSGLAKTAALLLR